MADAKKPALSSKIMGMKFMQRAVERKEMEKAQVRLQKQEADKQEHEAMEEAGVTDPVKEEEQEGPGAPSTSGTDASNAPSGRGKRKCVITYVRDPLPAAVSSGRMSFGAGSKAAEPAQDVVVTDADMAAAFQRGPQMEKGRVKEREQKAPKAQQQPQAGSAGGDFMSMGYKPLREAKKRKVT